MNPVSRSLLVAGSCHQTIFKIQVQFKIGQNEAPNRGSLALDGRTFFVPIATYPLAPPHHLRNNWATRTDDALPESRTVLNGREKSLARPPPRAEHARQEIFVGASSTQPPSKCWGNLVTVSRNLLPRIYVYLTLGRCIFVEPR